MEMQEQINVVTRSKDVVSKEKSRLTVEIQELMARIEVLSSEKTSMRKVVEKLEIQVNSDSAVTLSNFETRPTKNLFSATSTM